MNLAIMEKDSRACEVFNMLDVSQNTIKDYSYRIGLFVDFVRDRGLNPDTYLEYKRFLAFKHDYSVSTKNKYLLSARIWLNEIKRRGGFNFDPTANVRSFSQGNKHKKAGLTESEMNLIIAHFRTRPDTPSNDRLKAIVSLLTYQGLRLIELTRLDVNDLDLAHGIAFIWGKGRDDKERIHLHPETIKALTKYLKASKISSGALFVGLRGSKGKQRISVRGVQKLITGLLRGLKIDKSSHSFRHYFVTKLIRTFKSELVTVQKFTRHKDLEMLTVYNDDLSLESSLPRYFETFENVAF